MNEREVNNVDSDHVSIDTDGDIGSSALRDESASASDEELNLYEDPNNVEYSFLLTGRARPPGVLVWTYNWSVGKVK